MEKVINVMMEAERSIINKKLSYEQVAKTIANHMIASRGEAKPYWCPYIMQGGIRLQNHNLYFDGKVFYPNSKPGDVAYVSGNIWLEKDYELWINVIGRVKVYLDGECLFSSWEKAEESVRQNDFISLPVELNASKLHHLVIKSVCTEEDFGFCLNVSPLNCPGLWASFYLVSARVLLPLPGLMREEGMAVSPLYTGASSPKEAYEAHYDFEDAEEYAFPQLQKESNIVDFNKLYEKGAAAFAYTIAENDTEVIIRAHSTAKILINKETYQVLQQNEQATVSLKPGDEMLIKSMREDNAWGFEWIGNGIGLPMLETDRRKEFEMAFCGPFYQKGLMVKLPPEYAENMLKIFPDGKGGRIFWRFQNCYLRAYLNSSFSGQWYYATMLSYKGIRICGETFDVPEYVNYFLENERLLADWSEYAMYDSETFGFASFMEGVDSGELLDHIGTLGVNLIDAYTMTGDKRYLPLIQLLQWRIRHEVPRFEDGTFRRNPQKTMWADDFYMSCPFLVQLYSQMGDEDSLKDILCQLQGFVKRLYMPEEKIFSHIYFWSEEKMNRIPWGRGNGWIAFAMSEILFQIPEDNTAHDKIRKVFCEFCDGLAEVQDECGLWHQVLNRPESYLESSCTAMFTLAFYRGIRNGWFRDSEQVKRIKKCADKGLHAILERCVDADGIMYGVCMGSSCSMDPTYYFDLFTVKDDNHGTGILLMLLCEVLENK